MAKLVKLSNLTPKVVKQIVLIYHDTVGGILGRRYDGEFLLKEIKADLQNGNSSNWSFGSRLAMRSRFKVVQDYSSPNWSREDPVIKFEFYANTDRDDYSDKQAEELSKAFEGATDQYLVSLGLAL